MFQQIKQIHVEKIIFKIMDSIACKFPYFIMIVIGIAVAMPADQKFGINIPQQQIVGSDASAQGQLLAIVTKNGELRVYNLYKSTYQLIQSIKTCEASSVNLSTSPDHSFFVNVNCRKNGPQKFIFDSEHKIVSKSINLKSIDADTLNQEVILNRILQQNATDSCNGTCENSTQCVNGTCVVPVAATGSPTVPLAVGIPLASLALIGLVAAKIAIGKSAATSATTFVRQPARIVQVQETSKFARMGEP